MELEEMLMYAFHHMNHDQDLALTETAKSSENLGAEAEVTNASSQSRPGAKKGVGWCESERAHSVQ